jgi:diadenylate cyclase
VVMAAGRYLLPAGDELEVPLGLGARHMVAAGVSAATGATAIAVSQTTGAVRVFRDGAVVLELLPQRRRT